MNELTPVHNGPVPLNQAHPFWLFMVLMVIASLVVIVRIFYRKNISEITRAFLSMSITGQLMREENILQQRASIILTLIFNLTAAYIVWQFGSALAQQLPFSLNDFGRFLFFAFLISIIYSIKYVVLRLAGFIFETSQEMDAYIFNIFLSNNIFGMVLFPIAVILFLYPQLSDSRLILSVIIVLALLFYIFRLLRGILIGRASSGYTPVYLFLYICALEIAPLMVLLKLASLQ